MSMRREPNLALYLQVADVLRGKILSGEMPPGALLPSEKYLAEEFGVGRDTIRDALQRLRFEGMLDGPRGGRARVHEARERTTVTLRSSEEVIARMPTPDEARQLRLPAGQPLLELRRGEHVERFPAHSTTLRGASPTDWTATG